MKRFLPQVLYRFSRAAWVTLVISLSLVLAANYAFYVQACKLGEHQFEVSVEDVVQAIDERMRQHAQILLGSAGLFNASATVDRLAWQRYIESLQLDQYSHGIQGLGYSEVILPKHLENRIQSLRAEGFPGFDISPTGVRSIYSAILYLEPLTARNQHLIGHDMLADPRREAAMRHAAENGTPTLSGQVKLLTEKNPEKSAGFLMYQPVYRLQQTLLTAQDRGQALQGFVFIPFRVQDLMRGLLGERERPLKFQIFDGLQPTTDALLFASGSVMNLNAHTPTEPQWTTSRVISAYGRDWTVQFQSRPAIETSWLSARNGGMLAMGVGLSLLLFLFVTMLNSRRARAEAMALEMTTELRRQTQQLQESQQMLDVIVDNIPAGVFVKDTQAFRYQLVNRAWREMHDRTGEALIGKTVHEVFDQTLADHFAADDRRAFASGLVQVNEESRLSTPLGHERVLRTMKVSVRNETGKTSHLLGISMDITEQVAARTAMKESAQLMQVVFDNVADGIVTLDREGRVHSMNRAAELMFGYTSAEVQGQSFHMLTPQTYHARLDEFFKKRFQTHTAVRKGVHQELEGRGKDGRIFPMELAVSTSMYQGAPLFISLVRDISERKHSEQMKASFVSTVSHELRTPLTAINGALGLVCGGVLGDVSVQAKAMLDIAYKNSHRLTLLINDLLDLEKMAADKMRLDMSVEELTPLVEQAIATAEATARRHQVRLRLQAPSEPVRVRVDANRLQQVLGNLLSNAVKYSDAGGQVDVTVGVCPDQGVVRVQVTDHGPGVPAAFRGQIFQKFSQAESSDSRGKGGSGLGLAISKELVERMHGLIGYESIPGQGASFHFVLPVWVAPTPSQTEGRDRDQRVGARILVVEDNAAAADHLVAILQRAGYGVDVACTGAVALTLLEKNQYVAITLDMVLPDQTGVAMVRALRTRPELDRVPILVVSTATEMGKLALQDGVMGVEWMDKPVDEADLIAVLERRLSVTRSENDREASYET